MTAWAKSKADRQRIARLVNAYDCAAATRAWRKLPDDVRTDADRITSLRLAVQYCSRGGRIVKIAGRWQPVSVHGRVLSTRLMNSDKTGYATRTGAAAALMSIVRGRRS